MKKINVENGYKYIGILEVESVKNKKMKENMENIINAINSRAVSIIKYSAGIVEWKINEYQIQTGIPKAPGPVQLDPQGDVEGEKG